MYLKYACVYVYAMLCIQISSVSHEGQPQNGVHKNNMKYNTPKQQATPYQTITYIDPPNN